MDDFHSNVFPSFERPVDAIWAPLLIEPIEGAYDRLVFAVAVASKSNFHIEVGNRLDRLRCLYDDQAEAVLYAIELSIRDLTADLIRRSVEAIREPKPMFVGVAVGNYGAGQGESLPYIGKAWMKSLSSLYSAPEDQLEALEDTLEEKIEKASTGDRLPILIKDYVTERREGLLGFFSDDVRMERKRRSSARGAEVNIDFAGSKLVANFGTLQATQITSSANRIKTRLWELKVNRDMDWERGYNRHHQMIIQSPETDDPQFSEKQIENLYKAKLQLEKQADQEELLLKSMVSVPQIGDHLLKLEAA